MSFNYAATQIAHFGTIKLVSKVELEEALLLVEKHCFERLKKSYSALEQAKNQL